MTGENSFCLNQETVVEAVQLYLASRFKEGRVPKVTSVSSDIQSTCFVVIVDGLVGKDTP